MQNCGTCALKYTASYASFGTFLELVTMCVHGLHLPASPGDFDRQLFSACYRVAWDYGRDDLIFLRLNLVESGEYAL